MRQRFSSLFAGLVVMVAVSSTANASGADALTLRLICEPDTAEIAPTCAALRTVIANRLPEGAVFDPEAHVAEPGSGTPRTLDLKLVVERLRPDGLTARIDWRVPGSQWSVGVSHGVDIMDARLDSVAVDRLLVALWLSTRDSLRY